MAPSGDWQAHLAEGTCWTAVCQGHVHSHTSLGICSAPGALLGPGVCTAEAEVSGSLSSCCWCPEVRNAPGSKGTGA